MLSLFVEITSSLDALDELAELFIDCGLLLLLISSVPVSIAFCKSTILITVHVVEPIANKAVPIRTAFDELDTKANASIQSESPARTQRSGEN